MKTTTDVHPDAVFDALLAKGVRSNRRANLERVHDLCRARHEAGERDFSVAAISKLVEAEGILKGRGLYNAAAADYRKLIEAWAAYSGPPQLKGHKTRASPDYLMRIEDPAIRAIMQAITAERDTLKAEVNRLKSQCQGTIDRRPASDEQAMGHRASKAVADMLSEMDRQDAKWGANRRHTPFVWNAILQEEAGEFAQACLHFHFGGPHAVDLRKELIQIAAVALQAAEDLDRTSGWEWAAQAQAGLDESG